MSRLALLIVSAIVLLVVAVIGRERYKDWRLSQRGKLEQRVEDTKRDVAAAKDSVRVHQPGIARADSTLTGILRRPSLPRPTSTTRRQIVDAPKAEADTTQYVTLASYNALEARRDSTARAAQQYRDSTRAQLLRYPRLVAFQDSVVAAQDDVIATPKPRRNWGIGVSVGPGAAYVSVDRVENGVLVRKSEVQFSKFTVNVGVSYSF